MAKENKNINDNELNELLRGSFLEDNQSNLNDDLAKFVLDQEYDVKIDPTKEKEFIKKLSGGAAAGNTMMYLLISIISVIIIATVIYLIYNNNSVHESVENKMIYVEDTTDDYIDTLLTAEQIIERNNNTEINEDEIKLMETLAPIINNELRSIISGPKYSTQNNNNQKISIENAINSDSLILNEEVIIRFKKIKNMMLEKLVNKDKKLYVDVFAGKVNYIGEPVELTEFYVRNCVITNLEYKTFLIDLLMQGRKSDYDKAKPNSGLWLNYNMPTLAENYFKAEEYSDYPVVNISEEGAALFCKWFEQEAKLYTKRINKKEKEFTIRVPYDVEWMYLAVFGYSNIPDYDGYYTIFDKDEGYIDKALDRRVSSLRKRYKRNKPVNELFATNRYSMSESEILAIYKKGFEIHNPTPSDTIYPKRMKDYGKIGHVSEIILEKKSDKSIIYGTCWKDKEEFLDMMNNYTKSSGSPFVGMRIVIIYDNAPVYQNPFW